MNWFQIKAFVTKTKIKRLKEQLAYWEKYEPVNNMGKFARQVKIDSIKKQIDKIEK
jgi:hypothetical protein